MSSSHDLTARARIREAAVRLFADKGIGPATVRDIAQAAAVSSGLVRHHFGSKEGLRDACDDYAMARVAAIAAQFAARGGVGDAGFLGSVHPETMLLQRYLLNSMMDGSPAATVMFERLVDAGEQWLADQPIKSRDPRAYATALVSMKLGLSLLRDQISRVLAIDLNVPAEHVRLLRGAVEVFSQPLLNPAQAEELHAALDRLAATEES